MVAFLKDVLAFLSLGTFSVTALVWIDVLSKTA